MYEDKPRWHHHVHRPLYRDGCRLGGTRISFETKANFSQSNFDSARQISRKFLPPLALCFKCAAISGSGLGPQICASARQAQSLRPCLPTDLRHPAKTARGASPWPCPCEGGPPTMHQKSGQAGFGSCGETRACALGLLGCGPGARALVLTLRRTEMSETYARRCLRPGDSVCAHPEPPTDRVVVFGPVRL